MGGGGGGGRMVDVFSVLYAADGLQRPAIKLLILIVETHSYVATYIVKLRKWANS